MPLALKMPSAFTRPSSALYCSSAAGLAIVKLVSAMAGRNDEDGLVRLIVTSVSEVASQESNSESSGAPLSGSVSAKPPNTVCQ